MASTPFLCFEFNSGALIFASSDLIQMTRDGSHLSITLSHHDTPIEVAHVNGDHLDSIFEKVRSNIRVWEFQTGSCHRMIPIDCTRSVQYDGEVILLTLGRYRGETIIISFRNDSDSETQSTFELIMKRLHAT